MPTKNARGKISRHNTNKIRIIAGDWRGRKLTFPSIPGLRPTGDRMRETLFNWLAPYIHQARVLDLFAGSGALGIEALSRGANNCIFVESDQHAARGLAENLSALKCKNAQVMDQDAFKTLNTLAPHSVDILFLDPPFDSQLHNRILDRICSCQALAQAALVYIEAPVNETIEIPANWLLLNTKVSGQVSFSLYMAKSEASS